MVMVDERDVLGLFAIAQNDYDGISLPQFPELPADYVVQAVHHDFYSQSFAFRIWHPSFAPVEPGYEIPRLISPWKMQRTCYVRPAEFLATSE